MAALTDFEGFAGTAFGLIARRAFQKRHMPHLGFSADIQGFSTAGRARVPWRES
jgi:hypothetical protein